MAPLVLVLTTMTVSGSPSGSEAKRSSFSVGMLMGRFYLVAAVTFQAVGGWLTVSVTTALVIEPLTLVTTTE